MTHRPKDDSGQIRRKGHRKRVISLLNEVNNCHIKLEKIRQQTAQDIFEEIDVIIEHSGYVSVPYQYKKIKQKYLGD